MDGQSVKVVENNEHLGQIVSGQRQEEKNIELRIKKSQNSLFVFGGLVGNQMTRGTNGTSGKNLDLVFDRALHHQL